MKFIFNIALIVVTAGTLNAAPSSDQEKEDAFFDKYDVNRDNRITRQEMPSFIRSRFNAYDRNRNGFVTRQELRASTIASRKNSSKRARKGSFAQLDRNNDGFISKNEMPKQMKRKRLLYDINNDGRFSKHEFLQMRKGKVHGRTSYGAKTKTQSFNQFDRNRDGIISKHEMTGVYRNKFYVYDRNRDGVITRKEFYRPLPKSRVTHRTNANLTNNKREMSRKVKRIYANFDANGDGELNLREYRNLINGHVVKKVIQKRVRTTNPNSFDYHDKNYDGVITKNEMPGNQFYAFDLNANNKISRQEFRSVKQDQNRQENQHNQNLQNQQNQQNMQDMQDRENQRNLQNLQNQQNLKDQQNMYNNSNNYNQGGNNGYY